MNTLPVPKGRRIKTALRSISLACACFVQGVCGLSPSATMKASPFIPKCFKIYAFGGGGVFGKVFKHVGIYSVVIDKIKYPQTRQKQNCRRNDYHGFAPVDNDIRQVFRSEKLLETPFLHRKYYIIRIIVKATRVGDKNGGGIVLFMFRQSRIRNRQYSICHRRR